jgi:hypothetical protein
MRIPLSLFRKKGYEFHCNFLLIKGNIFRFYLMSEEVYLEIVRKRDARFCSEIKCNVLLLLLLTWKILKPAGMLAVLFNVFWLVGFNVILFQRKPRIFNTLVNCKKRK